MGNQEHYFQLFKSATAVVLDVDGVLTDGSLIITEKGEQLRTMNIRDGYALKQGVLNGLVIAIISGSISEGVTKRLNRLGVREILMKVKDKSKALKKLAGKRNLDLSKTIYIGDDVPDLDAMKLCGVPCCPADAIPEILSIAKYISPLGGGKGCVRDILEKVLKLQGKWE
ncbi:MAG TPA: HAD hydrolase family protein [Chitinophagales bacterium]|nr:HAD hydrolase family protein [Chitinophagales bacterium]